MSRYVDLPEHVRIFLENLGERETADLAGAIDFYRSIKTVGKFTRWLLITIIGAFVGAASFGEAIMKLLGLWRGGGH